MKKEKTLHSIIYKNYLTSSLIPIFAIELVLLLLYFGVSYFISQKSSEILYLEASQNLQEITKREAQQINYQFQEVSRNAEVMRQNHEDFFANPQLCVLPKGEPKFSVHENGVYYKTIDNGGSSLYYAATTKMSRPEMQKARCSESIDSLMKSIVDINPIITQAYLNTYDNLNRLYPYMPDAPKQYGPDLNMRDYNFYYLADKEHNPEKKPVWTSAYLDPAGQGWMISNIVPIYRGNFLEAVSGLDVTIDSLVRNILTLEIPWEGSAFMVDEKGMILAMPQKVEHLFELKELKEHIYNDNIATTIEKPEEYNIFKVGNETIRNQLGTIFKNKSEIKTIKINETVYLMTQTVIPETGWRLMTLVDESIIYAPMKKLKEQTDALGYFIIGLMLFFYMLFFMYLLKKSRNVASLIAEPIEELSILSTNLGNQPGSIIEKKVNIEEVDRLIQNYNQLSTELDTRTKEYIQGQMREKMIEKDAEVAYRAGLFENASTYLHNVGNTLTMLDSKIRLLRDALGALKKSGLGVNKAVGMVQESEATLPQKEGMIKFLGAFNKALTEDVTSEIEEITIGIEQIKEHAVETIRHQQDQFNSNSDASKNYIQNFDVKIMLENMVEDYRVSCIQKGVSVHFNCPENLFLFTTKFQFQSGLNNVFKNALESIFQSPRRDEGDISINAFMEGNRVIIEMKDNGTGIKPENVSKMFKFGFTTKQDGHGLGLHAFNNFLNSNNGKITAINNESSIGVLMHIEIGATDDK